jgi:hypothetical protein
VLSKYRNEDEHFIAVFQSATETAQNLDVTVKKPRQVGRSIYRYNAGDISQSVESYYKLNMFFPLVDSICTHLKDRFGPVQQKLFGLSALIPAYLGSYTDILLLLHFTSLMYQLKTCQQNMNHGVNSGPELVRLNEKRLILQSLHWNAVQDDS